MVTAWGSQIALNFLSLDIRTDSNQRCLSDSLTIFEPEVTPASMLGSQRVFCGQKLPNYPGPSILVSGLKSVCRLSPIPIILSASNSLVLKYQTDDSRNIKGSGFKAMYSIC